MDIVSQEIPTKEQTIARVIGGRGNNLYAVEDIFNDTVFIVFLPATFRELVTLKPGDYVVIDPMIHGHRFKTIYEVLTKCRIKFLKQNGAWANSSDMNEKDELEDLYEFVNKKRKEVLIPDDIEGDF